MLLEELKKTGVKCVSFTGSGDPLFYPYMDEILKKCHELGLKVGVTSNFAMKISDNLIKKLLSKFFKIIKNVLGKGHHLFSNKLYTLIPLL